MPIDNVDHAEETIDFEALIKIRNHLEKIVKNRTMILTGDTSHISIDNILDSLTKINESNTKEKALIDSLCRFIPYFELRGVFTMEQIDDVIAGNLPMNIPANYDCKCYDCGEKLSMGLMGNLVYLKGPTTCKSH